MSLKYAEGKVMLNIPNSVILTSYVYLRTISIDEVINRAHTDPHFAPFRGLQLIHASKRPDTTPNGLEKWTDQEPFQATPHIPETVDRFLVGLLANLHALGTLLEMGDIHGHNSSQGSSQPTATRH